MYLIVDLCGGLDFVTDDLDRVNNWEEACEVGDMEIYKFDTKFNSTENYNDPKEGEFVTTILRWNGQEFVNVERKM